MDGIPFVHEACSRRVNVRSAIAIVSGERALHHGDQARARMRMPAGRTSWIEGHADNIDIRVVVRLNLRSSEPAPDG
jgi:hypothetical protein